MIRSAVSVIVCAVLVFSLCACSAEKEIMLSEFEKDVSFTIDDLAVKGKLVFKGKDDITFTVEEPGNLKGLVFTEATANIDNITINYAKLKDESPVYILLSAIRNLAESEICLPLEGEYTLMGEASSAEYKIVFDCEKEEIIRIATEKFTYNFE